VSPLTRLEHALHPWSSFVVLPVFALANAGIVLDRAAIDAATDSPVTAAVAVALVAGKAVGLTAGTALAVRLGLSHLPAGVRWAHVAGVGLLAGIGFTVSLFITELAYDDPALVDAAKLGVLAGSVTAAVAGTVALRLVRRSRATADGR
jgi:Na+:H+ antiporter, NhaA family